MNLKAGCSLVMIVLLAGWTGCSTIGYKVREQFGQHKREVLVNRVDAAKTSQLAAKEQFVSTFARFKSVTGFSGGELEKKYDEVNADYERCVKQAREVRSRIDAVEDVARALFREWEGELDQYSSAMLRQASERQLRQTQQSYERLYAMMQAAALRMEPVLNTFRDQVLFLKHNLNARAVASLGQLTGGLQREIEVLIADMDRAIADATRFIDSMQAEPAPARN